MFDKIRLIFIINPIFHQRDDFPLHLKHTYVWNITVKCDMNFNFSRQIVICFPLMVQSGTNHQNAFKFGLTVTRAIGKTTRFAYQLNVECMLTGRGFYPWSRRWASACRTVYDMDRYIYRLSSAFGMVFDMKRSIVFDAGSRYIWQGCIITPHCVKCVKYNYFCLLPNTCTYVWHHSSHMNINYRSR